MSVRPACICTENITHGVTGTTHTVEPTWNVMAHSDAREGKWRGNWRMEWVASTLHTTSEHGVSSITTADALTSAASSRLNWRPRRFNPLIAELNHICQFLALLGAHPILHISRLRVKWTRPFRRKTISGPWSDQCWHVVVKHGYYQNLTKQF